MNISLMYFIKNEWPWIGYSLASMAPFVDEIVVFDETPELHRALGEIKVKRYELGEISPSGAPFIQEQHHGPPGQGFYKLFMNKPIDVMNQKAYENLFNRAIKECTGDWIIWLHADMIAYNGWMLRYEIERITEENPDAIRMSFRVTSFLDRNRIWQGHGRRERWPLIVRNDHGLHYFGRYGHPEEDFYFFDLTGEVHESNWSSNLPYNVFETDLHVAHFSDAKPRAFRAERMRKCLSNQLDAPYEPGKGDFRIESIIGNHPRVTHEAIPDQGFGVRRAKEADLPPVFKEYDFGFPEVD